MTNAQHYWPGFCKAVERPELENDPRFATDEARAQHAHDLVEIIEGIFRTKTYAELIEILTANKLVWSPVKTPFEVTQDEQAQANEFFVDWKTRAEIRNNAPELGEHTEDLLKGLGYAEEDIARMKASGVVG
jgi:crotonobetainyl-CoA:carnitine CoA-transferase CaiB-like acyl-CoA transferase